MAAVKGEVEIRSSHTRELEHSIPFEGGPRRFERFLCGLLLKVDSSRFYVDSSRLDDLFRKLEEETA